MSWKGSSRNSPRRASSPPGGRGESPLRGALYHPGRLNGMFRELVVGGTAALRTPLWLRGRRIEQLLDRSPGVGPASTEDGDYHQLILAATCPEPSGAAHHLSSSETPPGPTGSPIRPALPGHATLAARAARGTIRFLARLPLSPWKNTCLYRSIAECLVLRHYGIAAAIRIGVRNERPPAGPIVAHAWVVYPG